MEDPVARALGPVTGLFSVLFVSALVAGLTLLVSVMFPGWAVQKMRIIDQKARACFWWGLGVSLVLIVLIAVLGHFGREIEPLGAAAGLLAVVLFVLFSLGLILAVRVVGQRVCQLIGWAVAPLSEILLGSLTIILTVFFPVIGWALFLYWTFVGIGVVVAPL